MDELEQLANIPTEDGKRPQNAVVEARVDIIYDQILSGYKRYQIQEYVRKKTQWGVCDKTVDYYITKARQKLKELLDIRKDEEIKLWIERNELLLSKAIGKKDFSTARQLQKDRADFLGIMAPTKFEIAGPGGGPIETTVTQMDKLTDQELEALERIRHKLDSDG